MHAPLILNRLIALRPRDLRPRVAAVWSVGLLAGVLCACPSSDFMNLPPPVEYTLPPASVRLTLTNDSGVPLRVDAVFRAGDAELRRTARHLEVAGVDSTDQVLPTVADSILLVARETTPRAASRVGDLIFERTLIQGVDYEPGGEISIIIPVPEVNEPPMAQIELAAEVTAGDFVQLDGRASTDPDGDALTYRWQQVVGPTVAIAAADQALTSFVAPSVAVPTTVGFVLTVHDGQFEDTAAAQTLVNPPAAPPGEPMVTVQVLPPSIAAGGAVTATATGSGGQPPYSFTWTQAVPAGRSAGVFGTPALATTTWTAPAGEEGTWTLTVTLTDALGQSASAAAAVAVFSDCNTNGAADDADAAAGPDCNTNLLPDACDVLLGLSADCNTNTVPDACEPDCNANAVPDECDLASGGLDCDADGTLDACQAITDCNANGTADACDIATGEPDCNTNSVPDVCENAADCNTNATPDACDLAAGESDCNTNGQPDACEGLADCNTNATPDECEDFADCNTNVVPDECDAAVVDCNSNGVPDACDVAGGSAADADADGAPDECGTALTGYWAFTFTSSSDCDLFSIVPSAARILRFDESSRLVECRMDVGGDFLCVNYPSIDGPSFSEYVFNFGSITTHTNRVISVESYNFNTGLLHVEEVVDSTLACAGEDGTTTIDGQLSADGLSMSGTWEFQTTAESYDSQFGGCDGETLERLCGTFTATRLDGPPDGACIVGLSLDALELDSAALSSPGEVGVSRRDYRIIGSFLTVDFDIKYYLSTDDVLDEADLFIGSETVSGAVGGALGPHTGPGPVLTFPAGATPPCSYYVIGVVDGSDQIDEPNEVNNALAAGPFDMTEPGAEDCNSNEIPDACEKYADCNENGTADECDLAAGTPDCNTNAVPDLCDGAPDCNTNGTPDECDLAAGEPDCNTNAMLDACDLGGLDGTMLYGVQGGDCCGGRLYRIDAETAEITLVADLEALWSELDLCGPSGVAVSPDGQKLCISLNFEDAALRYDLATGQSELVGHFNDASPSDIAFLPNGALIVSDPGGTALYDVDPGTGSDSLRGQTALALDDGEGGFFYDPVRISGLAVAADGTLYGSTGGNSGTPNAASGALFVVDPQPNGDGICIVTPVGSGTGFDRVAGLAALPDGRLLGATARDLELIEIDPDTGQGTLIGTFFGDPDVCSIDGMAFVGGAADCNTNAVPDECDLAAGAPDCNSNGIPDACELAAGDCNTNAVPDACEALPDCNTNAVPDLCEGLPDCNTNAAPDVCEGLPDCNSNGTPDECEGLPDCNTNAAPDVCEGLPDCNSNSIPDVCDLPTGDCNTNGTLDECEPPGAWTQEPEITRMGAAAFEQFGTAVAMSPGSLVIGDPVDDGGGSASGAVAAYLRDGASWMQAQTLTAFDASFAEEFGASLSVGDAHLAVGAPGGRLLGNPVGAVYVYSFNGLTYASPVKLTALDAMSGDRFGESVSLSGDSLLVGATQNDNSGANSGSAYVFRKTAFGWNQQAKLTALDAAGDDQFGFSVALSGDTALVGAWGDDDAGAGSGSAYVFVRIGGVWIQSVKLTASDAEAGDRFGWSVALSGDVAVIGAIGDSWFTGAAYVFRRQAGAWMQEAKLIATDGMMGEEVGFSVAALGDVAAVGARGDNGFRGAGYVFSKSGGSWMQRAKLTASDAAANQILGASVAMIGTRVVLGAPDDDTFAQDAGSAYSFNLSMADCNANAVPDVCEGPDCNTNGLLDQCEAFPDCNTNGTPDACDAAVADCNGNAVPDACDTAHSVVALDQKLLAPDPPTQFEYFGSSVAVSGSFAVIGDPYDSAVGSSSGSARVFAFSGGAWTQQQVLTGMDTGAFDQFGAAVALEGNLAVIGAPLDDDGGSSSGSAYVFRFNGSVWQQEAKLVAADPAASDQFGAAVALSGNVVIVGANGDDAAGSFSGSAYIFTYNGAAWPQTQKLTAADGAAGAAFGTSVSVGGVVAAVGAPYDGANSEGAAYVFRFNGATWVQEIKLIEPGAAASAYFGYAVAADGSTVAVGRTGDGDGNIDPGRVYVYGYNGVTWPLQQALAASDPMDVNQFGGAVALKGDRLLAGAPGANSYAGAAYLFRRFGGVWGQEARVLAPDGASSGEFGGAVALDADDLLIGARYDDQGGPFSGSAYVFTVTTSDCNANGTPDDCDIAGGQSSDSDENGVPDECEQ